MKRIKPIHIRFIGLDAPENKPNLQVAYNRLFALAEAEIRKRKEHATKEAVHNQ
ncbi:MAG TPA: hypothetical protein VJI96_01735 [Candidatus Andersenbacteria bacterium]|nr:hypothetical protein [Candidatus Andersenbacteria bacterium]